MGGLDGQDARLAGGPLGPPLKGLGRELQAPGEGQQALGGFPGGLVHLFPKLLTHPGQHDPLPGVDLADLPIQPRLLGGATDFLPTDPLPEGLGRTRLTKKGQTGQG